jgi:hypothetical protein
LNSLDLSESECEKYFCDNFSLEINIPLEVATKSLKKFFELSEENTEISIDLH